MRGDAALWHVIAYNGGAVIGEVEAAVLRLASGCVGLATPPLLLLLQNGIGAVAERAGLSLVPDNVIFPAIPD